MKLIYWGDRLSGGARKGEQKLKWETNTSEDSDPLCLLQAESAASRCSVGHQSYAHKPVLQSGMLQYDLMFIYGLAFL